MSALRKIHILDQVGLEQAIVEASIVGKTDSFTYHSPSMIAKNLDGLEKEPNGELRCLILIPVKSLGRTKNEIPPNLRKKVALAIVASSEEIEKMIDGSEAFEDSMVIDIVETPVTSTRLSVLLRRAKSHFKKRERFDALHSEIISQRDDLQKLNEIGMALSSKRDITALLETILSINMEISNADAGSIYIVEDIPDIEFNKHSYFDNKCLRFRHAKNSSRKVPFKEFTMPISPNSIAGYAALSGKPLNLPDVYNISDSVPYGFGGRKFDESIGYRTMSMLTVPMLNRDNKTIGVIQLINKKRLPNTTLKDKDLTERMVVTFEKRDENFIYSLASQAAVAYENRQLYDSIRNLFEGFIKASVTAIEARDPTTSGHSERVATLTIGLAETVDRVQTGSYKNISFSRQDIQEIKYASLLHDFGKIGVREPVLVKAKKLYEHERQAIESRYNIIKKSIELAASKKQIRYLLEKSRDEALQRIAEIDRESHEKIAELDEYLEFILKVNEPTILKSEGFEKLKEIQSKQFIYSGNESYSYLTENESIRLMIPKGSLDEDERRQIESHVTHTYNFLKQIPWTNDLRNVPLIAYAHHEKLDGSGYPLNIPASAIPVQSKMMTISDIFDALTAQDRPYKKAVPLERALSILGFEVDANKIDPELYKIFLDAKIFNLVNHTPEG